MALPKLTHKEVCQVYREFEQREFKDQSGAAEWPYDVLSKQTGHRRTDCLRAMVRAQLAGYIAVGGSLRTGSLTDAGRALLDGEKPCVKT